MADWWIRGFKSFLPDRRFEAGTNINGRPSIRNVEFAQCPYLQYLMLNTVLLIYLVAGTAFGVWLLNRGLPSRDVAVQGTGLWFKLMIFPCCILLWPVLLVIFLRGGGKGLVRGEWRHADGRARRRHHAVWMVLPWLLFLLITSAVYLRKG